MRFAVFGVGGVGGYFGGRLAQAGEAVTFIARGEHLRAIRERGLRVDSLQGDFVIQPAQATDKPAEIEPVEAVILGVKAWQVREAAEAMRPLIGPATLREGNCECRGVTRSLLAFRVCNLPVVCA